MKFFSWIFKKSYFTALAGWLSWIAENVYWLFSKIRTPIVYLDAIILYIRQNSVGVQRLFRYFGSVFGTPLRLIEACRVKILNVIVNWTQSANRMGLC